MSSGGLFLCSGSSRDSSGWCLCEAFFTPFEGDFKGQFYHTDPIQIKNAVICAQFVDFTGNTIVQQVASGVFSVWGERLESSRRPISSFLLQLNRLSLASATKKFMDWRSSIQIRSPGGFARHVLPEHFQTTFQDKSGYQHVRLHP